MVDYGFISIHRSLQSHWLWNEKPFDKRAAWIDLLLLANFQDNKFVLGNELVSVERGSFITSELKLMERWGWSKTKVRSFLKLLENDNMIVKKSDTKKTAITIVNYSVYQDKRTTKEPEKNREETAEKLQKDTNNKDNKENKEKKENSSVDYSKIINDFKTMCPNLPIPQKMTDSRKKTLDAWIKDSGIEQVKEVFEKVKQSDFLSGRVTSSNGWKATFDWIIKPSNRLKILEGNYDNANSEKGCSNKNKIVDTTPKPNDLSIFD